MVDPRMALVAAAGLGLLAFLHFKVGPRVDQMVDRWFERMRRK